MLEQRQHNRADTTRKMSGLAESALAHIQMTPDGHETTATVTPTSSQKSPIDKGKSRDPEATRRQREQGVKETWGGDHRRLVDARLRHTGARKMLGGHRVDRMNTALDFARISSHPAQGDRMTTHLRPSNRYQSPYLFRPISPHTVLRPITGQTNVVTPDAQPERNGRRGSMQGA
ncbi:hypothetical protein BD414DRAFT_283546 [Trametes punicea]|nr:hypothetical protein BD414DRAFT_283546 [Trametes punicea]